MWRTLRPTVDISKDFFDLEELRPGGQADLPRRSKKQTGTDFVLQSRDPFRKSRLAQRKPFACSSEVKFFGDRDEAFQLSNVQFVTLNFLLHDAYPHSFAQSSFEITDRTSIFERV